MNTINNKSEEYVDLAKEAARIGIRFFLIAYAPLNTATRTCLVPSSVISQVQKEGCTFCGSLYFKTTAADSELSLVPDPSTFIQLPWKPEVAWVIGNLYLKGTQFNQCPRNILRRKIDEAKKRGYVMKSGVEAEFMLFNKARTVLTDEINAPRTSFLHDPTTLLAQFELLTKINDIIEQLGWQPYRIYHEAASSQYEINFGYEDAFVTSDRLCFFKFMTKELANLQNMSATFMPMPCQEPLCGNGLHINISMWNEHGNTNLFPLRESSGRDCRSQISKVAYFSIGGMLRHAKEVCALLCPSVNSYKRLNKGSWCPSKASWGFENRTAMIRIPNEERLEHRMADSTCNPYLAHAALLVCALDGIQNQIDAGEPINVPISEVKDREFLCMPTNLFEALQHLKDSKLMRKELGDDLINAFISLKDNEFKHYSKHLSQWELDNYYDC